ncbi:uncharacterized protein PAC_17541 [Phialocephala subalpina]|uniref:Uncharacterized protein n=1 Tax=Phialocephala subalpina TaxID=576137 RepID=A0A1L7XRF6_9HELO|nr:uncharacterized protein PAC_17541 [Phialocephala subalpina]
MSTMIELTVGLVASMINVAVCILQLTLPFTLAFVLVGVLDDSNSAITWSIMGGYLHGSSWPTILRTDIVATLNVNKKVIVLSTLSTISLILLIGVSIIAPIGLYSALSIGPSILVDFQYAPDTSPMSLGTPSRDNYNASRLCGFLSPQNCPGQAHGWTFWNNDTMGLGKNLTEDAYVSSVVPQNITDIFCSGSVGNRSYVAGALDIQYRSYIVAAENVTEGYPTIDDGRKRTQSAFIIYQSLILNDAFDVVEGLIVNSKTGGVGFRNHTLPTDPAKGCSGRRVCSGLSLSQSANLTVGYIIPNQGTIDVEDMFLTDRGGFVNLTHDWPFVDFNDSQARPELYARAYRGAILNNFNLMKYFNETRNKTSLGKTYNQFDTGAYVWLQPNQIKIESFPKGPYIPGIGGLLPSHANSSIYSNTSILTRGFGGGDDANITNIAVETGVVMGVASRPDGGSRLDPGTKWNAPIYSCATAMKAYIMDVSFLYNGTKGLASLEVTKAEPRTYTTNATIPLWAVEDTGMPISDVSPFWGLVDDKFEHTPHMWTLRREHLYLPAGSAFLGSVFRKDDSSPAAAPGTVLSMLYQDAASDSALSPKTLVNYGGGTNYPLFLKWKRMPQNSTAPQTMLNLIWTDIMANYVMGARSTTGGAVDNATSATTRVRVHKFRDTIKYDIRYAIPAIVFSIFYIIALSIALVFLLLGKARFQQLRMLLNRTSVGRAVSVERYEGVSDVATSSTKKWIVDYGDEDIGIRKSTLQRDQTPQENMESGTPAASKPLMQQGSEEESERLSDVDETHESARDGAGDADAETI